MFQARHASTGVDKVNMSPYTVTECSKHTCQYWCSQRYGTLHCNRTFQAPLVNTGAANVNVLPYCKNMFHNVASTQIFLSYQATCVSTFMEIKHYFNCSSEQNTLLYFCTTFRNKNDLLGWFFCWGAMIQYTALEVNSYPINAIKAALLSEFM